MIETKTAFIVIDPSAESSTACVALNNAHRLRRLLELYLWVLPRIKNLSKKYSVSIISPEDAATKELAKKEGFPIIEKSIPEQSITHAFEQAVKLSEEWHLYRDLPKLFRILNVNIAEVLEGSLMIRFFSLFKQMELADILLEHERPEIIYLQSNLFSLGQTFNAVAAAKGIKHGFLEPLFYRNLKYQLKSYLRYKISRPRHFNVYSIPQKPDNAPKYKVLMDTPSVNFFNALFPVIQEISNLDACACYILGNESDFSEKIKNIQTVNIENTNLVEYKEKLTEISTYYHSKLKRDKDFQNMFVYKGINFWNIIRDDIAYLFDRKFADVILDIVSFNKVIEAIEPNILVVGDNTISAMRGHVLLAKERNIPVLEVQHGLWSPRDAVATPLPDKIAAGGAYWKKIYMKFGAHEEQIVVTGWPKFDIYKKLKDEPSKQDKDTTNILFATHATDVNLNLRIIEAIGSFTEDSSRIRLIVKPHPAENEKIYERTVQKYKNVVLHKSKEDITGLLTYSDVVMIVDSTVGLEAAFLEKSIICINIDKAAENEESIYISIGFLIEVRELEELMPAIKDALYNEDVRQRLAEARKKFVYEYAYLQGGNASKRVADLIIQMIEELKMENS